MVEGQEWVWDYPRPPRLERANRRIRVEVDGELIVDSSYCFRILETSHPPTYYVPLESVQAGVLLPLPDRSWCEFKGAAHYFDLRVGARTIHKAGWGYESPVKGYEELAGTVAFYPSKASGCYVDDERVRAQEGDFYGGWVTSQVVGPFKGGPATWGW